MRISTHVIDIAIGRPAKDMAVRLERSDSAGNWELLSSCRTDQDGRCSQLLPESEALTAGTYRLCFDTENYFAAHKLQGLYPEVDIVFNVRIGEDHFHIPLLLSSNGYTTYRGS